MYSNLLKNLEAMLPLAEKTNPNISQRGVDWHLEHTLKIIISIGKTLEDSKPENFKPRFSLMKSVILLTGYIPRGRAKSPKPFNNKEQIDHSQLPQLLASATTMLERIDRLPPNSYFEHPYFGHLNLAQAKKFILFHSNHHLKIMQDIVK